MRNFSLFRSQGFTLLELLVAIAIFVLMSAMAYGGLNSVLESRQLTKREAERTAAIQQAVSFIQRDIEQIIERPIRDEFGSETAALLANDAGTVLLEFTREGYPNPAGLNRSQLQRVSYAFEDNTLFRQFWGVLDRAQDSVPAKDSLLANLDGIVFRYLDKQNQWHTNWPPTNSEEPLKVGLPKAVELTLALEDWGKIKRLFVVSGGVE